MTTRPVRPDQHGTPTGYQYGCRCDECRDATARKQGHVPRSECVMPTGKNSRCGQLAMRLIESKAVVARIARLANKSPKAFAKYADELAEAKAQRQSILAQRDEHMAECPGAAERFAS